MINWKGQTGVYIKQRLRGREQDSRETERESVRGSALQKRRDGVGHKMSH